MLSNIATLWPPNPGPAQTETGTKKTPVTRKNPVSETMVDLHEPAWWSGIRLTASTAEENVYSSQFRVRLLRSPERSGGVAFDACPAANEWIQKGFGWRRLPWPIPARMAKEMGLMVEVTLLDHPSDTYIGVTLSFHEMPLMQPRDSYMFVDAAWNMCHYWNGAQELEGSPYRGCASREPVWGAAYRIVPPSTLLTDGFTNDALIVQSWKGIFDTSMT